MVKTAELSQYQLLSFIVAVVLSGGEVRGAGASLILAAGCLSQAFCVFRRGRERLHHKFQKGRKRSLSSSSTVYQSAIYSGSHARAPELLVIWWVFSLFNTHGMFYESTGNMLYFQIIILKGDHLIILKCPGEK